jgi:hypothetical protein
VHKDRTAFETGTLHSIIIISDWERMCMLWII